MLSVRFTRDLVWFCRVVLQVGLHVSARHVYGCSMQVASPWCQEWSVPMQSRLAAAQADAQRWQQTADDLQEQLQALVQENQAVSIGPDGKPPL